MYIIDDKQSKFFNLVAPLLMNRGVILHKWSEFDCTARSKNSGIFVSLVDNKFNCVKYEDFISFFKKNKFSRAVLLKPACDEFKIFNHFNSAVSV